MAIFIGSKTDSGQVFMLREDMRGVYCTLNSTWPFLFMGGDINPHSARIQDHSALRGDI